MARVKPSNVGNSIPAGALLSDRQQVAAYVASMTAELAVLARRHRLDTLGYLLEMTRLEAEAAGQGVDDLADQARANNPPA